MAKIQIVEYDASHGELIADQLREFEMMSLNGRKDGKEDLAKWFSVMEQQAIMVTFLAEDRVAAVFAGLKLNKSTLEIWAFTGKAVDDSVREFWKASVRGLSSLIEVHEGLTRIQCHVDARHERSRAWVTKLGFINETPDGMKNYGPNDETFMLYARPVGGENG